MRLRLAVKAAVASAAADALERYKAALTVRDVAAETELQELYPKP